MTFITNILAKAKTQVFWTTLTPMLATFVYSILALFDIVPAVSESQVIEIATVIISFLGTVGIFNEHNIDTSVSTVEEIEV